MAWNDPGGNKNDPWGGGGSNNQGPPDLDEALKKLQEKLSSIFGGGGGTGSSGGGAGFGAGALGAVLLLLVVVWGLFGFYQVDQQERAVVLRLGVYHATVMPGLHWNPPLIDSVSKINTTRVRTASHRASMLTEDENIVEVELSVQYVVNDPVAFLLRVRSPETSLDEALQSSLRHVVGSAVLDQVITEGREQIAADVQERLQRYLETYETGIFVSQVNIEESRAPAQVQDAFDDVTRAREDRQRMLNQAEAYANSIIPEARGEAQRRIEEATGYRDQVVAQAEGEAARFELLLAEYKQSPEVMRRRLYIDTLQEVFTNTTKIMVDVEGGNNLLYLPLDKLMGDRPAGASATGRGGSEQPDVRELTDRVVQQLRRDSQTPRREGR